MSTGFIIAGAFLAACLAVVLLLVWRAREGHEDKAGFHFGSSDVAPENKKSNESRVA